MIPRPLPRRRLLRGLLAGSAVAIALPRLEAMLDGNGTAYADGKALPVRFGVWAFANGVHLERWVPRATGTAFDLPEQLAPLARHRSEMTVVSGLKLPFGGRVHAGGNTTLMTGAPLGGFNDNTYTALRPSIDQLVAERIGRDTPLRSIEVGVDDGAPPEKGTAFHWWSHNGPNSPNPCSYDCAAVFHRLFGGPTPGSAPHEEAVDKARRSVLDVVLEDAQELEHTLGASDRRRLEQHLEEIRAIERRAARRKALACPAPAAPAPGDEGPTNGVDYEPRGTEVNRTMSRLVAAALACDVTRVFTYQLLKPGSRVTIKSLGFALYHGITHDEPGDQPMCNSAVKFFMGELAVFLDALRATPEAGGTLLDRCALLATTDCTNPKVHGIADFPMLVFGRGGGRLRPGLHHRAEKKENACLVPFTLAHAAGARLPEFGEGAGRVTETFHAIEAV